MKIRTATAFILAALLAVGPAPAQWDRTKPAANSLIQSAEVRNNWTALQRTMGGVNLLADPTFLIWPAGDSTAPAHWSISGAGATIARTGTGLGDTNRKHGKFAAKLTAGGGATGYLTQSLLTTTSYDDGFDGLVVSAGAWVRATAASACRIRMDDGAAQTNSSYNTGASAWEWLPVSHTIAATATKIEFELEAAVSQVCHISAPTVVLGEVPPGYPQPGKTAIAVHEFDLLAGNMSVSADKDRWMPHRPGLILDVQLSLRTAPTTNPVIVDVNTWDGSAFTSMFSTRPQVAAGQLRGGAQPDTTYARRCVTAFFGSSVTAGQLVSYDVDAIGSGTVGADLKVRIMYLTFDRPLEGFVAHNELN
jgi:hypothetical protein